MEYFVNILKSRVYCSDCEPTHEAPQVLCGMWMESLGNQHLQEVAPAISGKWNDQRKKLKENYQEANSKSNVLNSALITKYLIMLMVICLFRAWLKRAHECWVVRRAHKWSERTLRTSWGTKAWSPGEESRDNKEESVDKISIDPFLFS